MSRQTHDNSLDHHGTIAESAIDGTPTAGFLATATGTGTPAWAVAPSGVPADLVTGDSSMFVASNGSWTNSGGTLTWDSTATYSLYGGSLKLVTTVTGQYVELPISGTFASGVEYQIAVSMLTEELTFSYWDVLFGLIGTDAISSTIQPNQSVAGRYVQRVVRWTPSANRTGVKVRINRNASTSAGNYTLHVGWAVSRASSGDGDPNLVMLLFNKAGSTADYGPGVVIDTEGPRTILRGSGFARGMNAAGGLLFADNGVIAITGPDADGSGNLGEIDVNRDDTIYMHAGSAAGSSLSGKGVQIQVGADYIGMFISEKDSTTIQMYDDSGGAYDIELVDQGSFHWRSVDASGVVRNLSSMESRKGSGSSTITSGNTSVTVTHGAGYTPSANDIVVTPTNNPTNDPGWFWIDTIGVTTFALNVRSDPGVSGAIFSWRVDR